VELECSTGTCPVGPVPSDDWDDRHLACVFFLWERQSPAWRIVLDFHRADQEIGVPGKVAQTFLSVTDLILSFNGGRIF
jgi:hypothetical protein